MRAGPAMALGMALAACAGAPDSGTVSAVYCMKGKSGAQVLAVKTTPSGQLRFGLSEWSPTGQNISVFGVAGAVPGGWRYQETGRRACRIDFAAYAAGGFAARSAPPLDCRAHGGFGTFIGAVEFPRSADEGPVTSELDDEEAFQHAGRCGAAP